MMKNLIKFTRMTYVYDDIKALYHCETQLYDSPGRFIKPGIIGLIVSKHSADDVIGKYRHDEIVFLVNGRLVKNLFLVKDDRFQEI